MHYNQKFSNGKCSGVQCPRKPEPETVNVGACSIKVGALSTAYYVTVKFGQDRDVMLSDSGCTQSVLHYTNTATSRAPHALDWNLYLVSVLADGNRVELRGITTLTFVLGTQKYPHRILVADIDKSIYSD